MPKKPPPRSSKSSAKSPVKDKKTIKADKGKTVPSQAIKNINVTMEFDDNHDAAILYGEYDHHLEKVEALLDIQIIPRGNTLVLHGQQDAVLQAESALNALWSRLKQHLPVELSDVEAAVRLAHTAPEELHGISTPQMALKIKTRSISARTQAQANYLRVMSQNVMTFGIGPAGTGKTYLAVAQAVSMMQEGLVERIVLSRPAVEAGERLGFLPGDMREKIDPYLRPLYDALYAMMPAEQVERRMANNEIEIAPLAFMRGRTLAHSFIILDEAQNTTPMQMKMALTRLGEGSRMVITGDLTQIDLPYGQPSGLAQASQALRGVDGIGMMEFTAQDITRHPLVTRIVEAYEKHEKIAAKFKH